MFIHKLGYWICVNTTRKRRIQENDSKQLPVYARKQCVVFQSPPELSLSWVNEQRCHSFGFHLYLILQSMRHTELRVADLDDVESKWVLSADWDHWILMRHCWSRNDLDCHWTLTFLLLDVLVWHEQVNCLKCQRSHRTRRIDTACRNDGMSRREYKVRMDWCTNTRTTRSRRVFCWIAKNDSIQPSKRSHR